jgi:hypothetical protein
MTADGKPVMPTREWIRWLELIHPGVVEALNAARQDMSARPASRDEIGDISRVEAQAQSESRSYIDARLSELEAQIQSGAQPLARLDELEAKLIALSEKPKDLSADIDEAKALALGIPFPKVTEFPIGYVYISSVATDPRVLLGYGTWARIAEGQVLVGFKTGDADFGTLLGTGGSKTVVWDAAARTETTDPTITVTDGITLGTTAAKFTADAGGTDALTAASLSGTVTADQSAHSHDLENANAIGVSLPPFVTVYTWVRTA